MIFDVEKSSVHGGSNRYRCKKPKIPSDNIITQNYYDIALRGCIQLSDLKLIKYSLKSKGKYCVWGILDMVVKILSIGATSKSTHCIIVLMTYRRLYCRYNSTNNVYFLTQKNTYLW